MLWEQVVAVSFMHSSACTLSNRYSCTLALWASAWAPSHNSALVTSKCEAEPLQSLLQTLPLGSCRGIDVGGLTPPLLQNRSTHTKLSFAFFYM